MPSVGVKLYSVFFKLLLKHRLQQQDNGQNGDGVTSRPVSGAAAGTVPSSPAFVDGIATKDIHIDHHSNLSIRIFLPECALPYDQTKKSSGIINTSSSSACSSSYADGLDANKPSRKGSATAPVSNGHGYGFKTENETRLSNGEFRLDQERISSSNNYKGYSPKGSDSLHRRLPIIFQFHGGGFVTGSKDSASNDVFCRKLAKLCDAIVIAVGYRLAPEHRYPAAFEDGFEAVKWLAKQANLADCNRSFSRLPKGAAAAFLGNDSDSFRVDGHREIVDTFGASVVEPWLAAHGDPSRCVLLGVSSGANIADYVARNAVQAGRVLEPIKIVAQVLMYPFFIGSIPTHSEIKLANSYFFDKATCLLAWKLFLPEREFDLDHVAANPLIPGREPPLKLMPPTLTVVAELDWMKDRAIAYSEALRKVNIDAPVLEYKDAVHEFATLDILVKSRQAEACAEDIAIWVKKYISLKGHEFSY